MIFEASILLAEKYIFEHDLSRIWGKISSTNDMHNSCKKNLKLDKKQVENDLWLIWNQNIQFIQEKKMKLIFSEKQENWNFNHFY